MSVGESASHGTTTSGTTDTDSARRRTVFAPSGCILAASCSTSAGTASARTLRMRHRGELCAPVGVYVDHDVLEDVVYCRELQARRVFMWST